VLYHGVRVFVSEGKGSVSRQMLLRRPEPWTKEVLTLHQVSKAMAWREL